jgi:hypothetical protein
MHYNALHAMQPLRKSPQPSERIASGASIAAACFAGSEGPRQPGALQKGRLFLACYG